MAHHLLVSGPPYWMIKAAFERDESGATGLALLTVAAATKVRILQCFSMKFAMMLVELISCDAHGTRRQRRAHALMMLVPVTCPLQVEAGAPIVDGGTGLCHSSLLALSDGIK